MILRCQAPPSRGRCFRGLRSGNSRQQDKLEATGKVSRVQAFWHRSGGWQLRTQTSARLHPRAQRTHRLADQLLNDRGHRLNTGHHPDRLPGHHRTGLDIAVDHRPPERARPRNARRAAARLPWSPRPQQTCPVFRPDAAVNFWSLVHQPAHRNDRQPRVELDRRHRVACAWRVNEKLA